MKKSIVSMILSLAIAIFAFTGCTLTSSEPNGIKGIQKTGTDGLVDTYTIYFDDGTNSTFTVTNGEDGKDGINGKDGAAGKNGANGKDGADGKDGKDGEDLSVMELYEAYKDIYGDIEYSEFLELYLSVSVNDASLVNGLLLSSGKVYAEISAKHPLYPINTYATGSCVIYSMDEEYTYVLTNYHVVYDDLAYKISDTIHMYLYGSESEPGLYRTDLGGYVYQYDDYAISCEYVGGSITHDIAVLRVNTEDIMGINPDAVAVTLADTYYVGEKAIAIGNPGGDGISVTAGIVSVDSEEISLSIDGISRYYRVMRIDTAIYNGNSGGGLFNSDGKLIGITNAGNGTDQNINYAIPVATVKAVAESIIASYEDSDSTTGGAYNIILGVTVTSENTRYEYDKQNGYGRIYEDITVDGITSGSIAERIGLTANDVLIAIVIDGVEYEVERAFHISDVLLSVRVGSRISLVYERDGDVSQTAEYEILSSDLVSVK